ncbi:MAG: hypothetical protein AAGI37_03125 [Planctomycetota bacterium]
MDKPDDLIQDLARAEHDILSFAESHGLSLSELVDWAAEPKTRRLLSGLCVLADAQTQLLLSRYRLIAATRLIAQATAEDAALPPEQVRRACVDLLKTELARAERLGDEVQDEKDEAFEAFTSAVSLPDPENHKEVPEHDQGK